LDNKYQEWLNANPNLQGTEDYSIVQDAAIKFNVDNPEEVTEQATESERITVDPIEVTPNKYQQWLDNNTELQGTEDYNIVKERANNKYQKWMDANPDKKDTEDYSIVEKAAQGYTTPPPQKPETEDRPGYLEGLKGGTERFISSSRTAFGALPFVDAEEAAIEGIERGENIKIQPGMSLEKVKEAYKNDGILAAGGEFLSQIPNAFGEQTSLLASIYAGAKAGTAIAGPYGGLAGSLLGAFLMMTGSNIERRAQEQIARGEDVDINKLGAVATGLTQSAVERAALGFSGVSKLLGINLAKNVTKEAAKEATEKTARESLKKALAVGTGKFVLAEGSTEIVQQVLERYYAGLPLTNDDAKLEYAEAAYGATLLFPLGIGSRISTRSRARDEIKAEEEQIREDSKVALATLLPNRAMFEAAQKDAEAGDVSTALEVATEAKNSMVNGAPEQSRLRKIINKANVELDESVTKQTVETQKKAVDTLLKDTQNVLKNFYKENKNVKATVTPGVLDKTTLTSFGLNPNSKAFKRLTHLNLNKPNNTKLFLDTLDKHTGKINEQVINDFTASIEESNPNVKYNFNKESQSSTDTGRAAVLGSRGTSQRTNVKKPAVVDGERVGDNLSTAPRPRTGKGNVDDTLTEDVRNQAADLIKVDPKKSFTPTTLQTALKAMGINLSPAENKTLITQLKALDNGIDVSNTGVKDGTPIQKIQAATEKVKAPVSPLQNVMNDINQKKPEVKKQVETDVNLENKTLYPVLFNEYEQNKKKNETFMDYFNRRKPTVKPKVKPKVEPKIVTGPVVQKGDETVEYIGKRPKGVTFTQITEDTGSTPEQIDALVSKGLIEVSTNENNERVALPTELNRDKTKLRKIISRLSSKPMDNIEFIEQARDEFNTPSDIKNYIEEGNKLIKDQKLGKPEAELTPAQEKKAKQKEQEKLLIDLGYSKADAVKISTANKYTIGGKDTYTEDIDYNPETDDFHTAGNPNYVQRPDQINRFKGVKNLKRALQILKSEYGNVLGEVETVLLDTMLKVPNLQTTGFSIEQVRTRDGGGAYGAYTADTNNVRIHPNANIGTIIHEALHAVQAKKMNDAFTRSGKPKNEAGRYINKIYERAQAAANGRFDRELNNVFEFVNYALQDVQFQRFLSETAPLNPKNNLNSLWFDLVNAIKKLFNFSTNIPNSLLNDYLVVAQDLLDGPPSRIVGSDPLYNKPRKNESKEEFRERVYNVKTDSDGVFKRIVKGIHRRLTSDDFPKTSLSGKFIRFRTKVANSSAAIQEEAQTRSLNSVFNDAIPFRARVDIIMDAVLQAMGIASNSMSRGYVIIQENGMPKIIDDSTTISGVFNLVGKLAKKVGNVDAADMMVQEYLIGKRLQGEQQLNEDRDRRISELENERSNTKNKSEKQNITEKINRVTKQKTDMSDDNMRTITDKDYLVSEQQYPELQQISMMLNTIQQRNIDLLEATGVYSKEKAAVFRSRDWYVPLNKTLEDLNLDQNGIKEFFRGYTDIGQEYKYKGGSDKQTANVLDNFVIKHYWSVNAALRNHGDQEAANFVGIRNKEKIKALEEQAETKEGLTVKQKKQLDRIKDENPDDIVTYTSTASIPDDRDGFVAELLVDGEKVYVDYADMNYAEALKGASAPLLDTSWMSSFATLLRQTITANPVFQAYQVFNDAMGSALYSGTKNPGQLAKRVLQSYIKIRQDPNSPILKQMEALGVVGGYGLTGKEVIGKTRRKYGLLPESKMRSLFAYFEDLATHSDMAQRAANFEQALIDTGGVVQPDGTIKGGNEILAVNKAINIINWNKKGSSQNLRLFTHTIPFLNAYIQGMDILINVMRGKFVSDQEKKLAIKLFAVTSAKIMFLNLIYSAAVGGNDEYEALPDQEKIRKYIIPGMGIGIPVRGELAFLFKMLPEGLYNIITKEGTNSELDARRIRQAITDTFFGGFLSPTLFPQAVKAPIEVMTNYSFFTGDPIVSAYQQKKETNLQVNQGTSYLAKGLGEVGISPLKTDHFIRATTGTVGMAATQLIDGIINQFVDNPTATTPIDKRAPISAILYSRNGRGALNMFYDLKDMSDRVTNSLNAMSGEEKADYRKDNKKLISSRTKILALNEKIKIQRDRRKKIIENEKLSPRAKAEKLRVIDVKMNKILKGVAKLRVDADLPLFSTR
tara:strand:+ start:790 stop:7257 length:6468 start_codon:yes stop_codon:yes gene_type:complete